MEDASAGLKTIFKVFIEVHWSLNLDKSAELGVIILDVYAPKLILVQDGMKPTDRDVYDSDVSFVSSAKSDSVSVGKVNYMHLPILFIIVFVAVDLLGLDDHVVLLWFLHFEYLMSF